MKRGIFHRAARGFAMVSAIVILVILAALGAAVVTVSTSQQMGSALDTQGARAYQAARAGLEWGLYKLQSSNGFDYANPNGRTCPATASFPLPATATTLSEFTVTVSCTPNTDPSPGGPTVYVIEATACSPSGGSCPGTVGAPAYIERRLSVSI